MQVFTSPSDRQKLETFLEDVEQSSEEFSKELKGGVDRLLSVVTPQLRATMGVLEVCLCLCLCVYARCICVGDSHESVSVSLRVAPFLTLPQRLVSTMLTKRATERRMCVVNPWVAIGGMNR